MWYLPRSYDACIIGLGPAGMGAALRFAHSPLARKVVCLDAGVAPEVKFCSILQGKGCRRVQPCQMITGVGGSSLLAGGKISSYPAGRSMARVLGGQRRTRAALHDALRIFEEYVPLTHQKTSIRGQRIATRNYLDSGFDFRYYDAHLYEKADLVRGYCHMLDEVKSSGMSVELDTEVCQIETDYERFRILAQSSNSPVELLSSKVILATGRYGTRLLESVEGPLGLGGQSNRFDFGVRLEFPSATWPDIDSCHNDLKLHFGKARTFCICKNGYVAPYRVNDIFLLEGHSDIDSQTDFTNLGITVRHDPDDSMNQRTFFSEIRRRLLEQTGGLPVRQRLSDYLGDRPSFASDKEEPASISYWRWGNVNMCFPDPQSSLIRRAVDYFVSHLISKCAYPSISVFAPTLDYYWPAFPLRQAFESKRSGLYLIGDCSGLFRGILQAFCSGLFCADQIVENHNVSESLRI